MRTLVLLIASPHFSAELWYDQLWPLFFSVVNGAKSASQKVRIFCAASHLAGKKFSIAHQFARIAVLQSGADALRQAQRDALTAQVQAQEQENAALAADIAEGATEDKMKEIAQEELGLISPNQRVFSVGN